MDHKIRPRSQIVIEPNLEIDVIDEGGNLIRQIRTRNMIVKSGRNYLRDLLGYPDLEGSTGAVPNYIQLGTSNTAPSDSQTALIAPVFSKIITRRMPEESKITFQLFVALTEANGYDLQEAGLLTFSSSQMWARAIYTSIHKTSSVSIIYNWRISIASS